MQNKEHSSESGIIIPENLIIEPLYSEKSVILPVFAETVHCAYCYSENQLKKLFWEIGNCKPSDIFVFGPLHKGPVDLEGKQEFTIYTDSSCIIEDRILTKNDEIVSEEYCKTILLPFVEAYFPQIRITQFLSPSDSPFLSEFLNKLIEDYPNSVFLFSNNTKTNCCRMWLSALNETGNKIIYC